MSKNKKSLSDTTELSAVTPRGQHMFAQVGLIGNVMLKDEAQRMKFASEVSMNFGTAVY